MRPPWVIPSIEEIFSAKALLESWREFIRGKKFKPDVAEFSTRLVSNLWELRRSIIDATYKHGGYTHFKINDQKPRDIHKASVRDRVIHYALHRALYGYFDRKFIFDSYSCRVGKGTHRALRRFADLARRESRNHSRTVWVLSCDVRKCFASVDHHLLKNILSKHIYCPRIQAVIYSVIDSFSVGPNHVGIPLGNLTSQLFINIYLNELDQHLKRVLGTKLYIRYADDFVIISHDKAWLLQFLPRMSQFLVEWLKLELRPNSHPIRTVASGVDFLGWVHFPDHRILRNTTKWRMFRRLETNFSPAGLSSYHGLLSHGNAWGLRETLGIRHGGNRL